jgi:ABC-type antimicrobial peptide transport system permease subunit
MSGATLPQRIAAVLLSALGLFAIAIAGIGLYGLVAFGVAQRSREFGIRMALGAVAGDVRRLVLGGALRLVVIGIACGVPVAAGVAFLVRSFLVVQPIDPVAFIGVPLLLAGCALLAAYQPARRATRQDPSTALRAE